MKSLAYDDPDYKGACRRLRARVVDVWATVICRRYAALNRCLPRTPCGSHIAAYVNDYGQVCAQRA